MSPWHQRMLHGSLQAVIRMLVVKQFEVLEGLLQVIRSHVDSLFVHRYNLKGLLLKVGRLLSNIVYTWSLL